jgi:lysyl-tRNA synthetase class 2
MSQEEIRQHRLAIRADMLQQGVQPYPQDGRKTHENAQALLEPLDTAVVVAGRIRSIRRHAKTHFFDIEDRSGRIQIIVNLNATENFNQMHFFDIHDFVRIFGKRQDTRTGEKSVLAQKVEMLSKAIRTLPDQHIGLSDEETRYRQRSVDLATNPDVVEIFRKRASIIQSVRQTLLQHQFLEVETPSLQPLYGGANARPFTTHINAWDFDLFLKISDELYLKYLVMGGIERVYEIDHNFRNEGVDRTHNPEFTMLECYAAYWDYTDMMTLTEELYRNAAIAATGSPLVTFQGHELDFSKPWRRITVKEAIHTYLNIDVDQLSDDELRQAIVAHGEHYKGSWVRGLGVAKLCGAVEKYLLDPTFLTDMPRETTSLCKPHRNDATLIERFEPYIMGVEAGNAYTELNDPVLQRQYWEEERQDDPEAHPLDEGFIEAMEYGMPPTGGLGIGIDRMVMFLTNQTKIRDVILFPTMKPLESYSSQPT